MPEHILADPEVLQRPALGYCKLELATYGMVLTSELLVRRGSVGEMCIANITGEYRLKLGNDFR